MTKKEIKNYGKSVRTRLLTVSKESGIPYMTILVRYLQERLLYRVSQSEFKENFYLKGGALLYAFNQEKARPTKDIDFLGAHISNDREYIKAVFAKIAGVACEEDGVIKREQNRIYSSFAEREHHRAKPNIEGSCLNNHKRWRQNAHNSRKSIIFARRIDKSNDIMTAITINIPNHEVSFFKKMISKMGWSYSEATVVCSAATPKEKALAKVDHAFGQLRQMKDGELQGINAEELLNELQD